MRRIRTPFERVQPQRIIRSADPHVVRNKIQYLPKAIRMECGNQPVERLLAAKFRVYRVVIHDVVSVRAARSCFQPGRSVQMTDAKPRQIGRNLRRLVESELFVKLYAISGAGCHAVIRHNTVHGSRAPSASLKLPSFQITDDGAPEIRPPNATL